MGVYLRTWCLVLACMAYVPAGEAAEGGDCGGDVAVAPLADRPRVGLVLSGGGARGAAHLGVLRVVEEFGIPVDLVVGTSMGSIVGALYASGMPLDDIERVVRTTDWPAVLDDAPPRRFLSLRRKLEDQVFSAGGRLGVGPEGLRLPGGLREGQNVRLMLRGLTRPVADIDCFGALGVPFAAVATDAQTGEPVVLRRGDLVTALRASMAIPGYFSPVDLDGRLLVDGGVANNMPVSVARAMGADVVIAVDIASPLATRAQLRSVFSVALQMSTILAHRGADAERATLGAGDTLVVPALEGIGTLDFTGMAAAVDAGAVAARATLAGHALRGRAAPGARPAARLADRHAAARQPSTLRSVTVGGEPGIPEAQLLDRLELRPGDELTDGRLASAITRVYGLDAFGVVDHTRTETAAGTDLVLLPQLRDWGPSYLKFGLRLYDDFEGTNHYGLGASLTVTRLNHFTGEWRTAAMVGETQLLQTELYQPLTARRSYFIAPWALYERHSLDVFLGDEPVARVRSGRAEAGLALGREFRNAEVRVGYGAGQRRLEVMIGPPLLPAAVSDVGYVQLLANIDSADARDFATRGGYGRLRAEGGSTGLGSDADYGFYQVQYDRMWPLGRQVVSLGGQLSAARTDAGISLEPGQLGGVLRMTAFAPGELAGDDTAMLRLATWRPLNEIRWLQVHGGLALELGGAWNGGSSGLDGDDLWPVASAFIGISTPLGPLYLAAGVSEEDRRAMHLQLGSRF